jgi:hypothetical protein
MKSLLRALSLGAMLSLTTFAAAHAVVNSFCYVECSDGTHYTFTNISTSDCCDKPWRLCDGSGWAMWSTASTTYYCP